VSAREDFLSKDVNMPAVRAKNNRSAKGAAL